MNKNLTVSKPMEIVSSLREPMALGEVFFQSGMFPDIKSQAQAVVKILKGRELGIAPLESLDNIFIVNGKTAVTSKIIAGLIKRSDKYDYEVNVLTDTECTLTFFSIKDDKKVELGKSTFTLKDAARALLMNKDTYKSYPRNLFFARALTNGSRWYCPDVFSGYTPEELEVYENIQGDETVVLNFDDNGEQKTLTDGEVVNAEIPKMEVKNNGKKRLSK